MSRKRKWIAGGALALAVLAGGTGLAVAGSGESEQQLTGSALDQATAAALGHTGGGTVIEAEAGDDGAAYGFEIRLADGKVVSVLLDASFHVTGDAVENEGATEKEGAADQDASNQS